ATRAKDLVVIVFIVSYQFFETSLKVFVGITLKLNERKPRLSECNVPRALGLCDDCFGTRKGASTLV
ncbi:MAG: hypothetical protein RBR06_06035, partial [Desulfuromonadaceae bacterium]|nr:hypothetical protein [Desulfuromonadaceae bacterium]